MSCAWNGRANRGKKMIEILEGFPTNVLAFACHGHVTEHDYHTVLVPAVAKALEDHDRVRLYYETAADFDGIDAGAVLEDIKVGLGHLSRWERMAVVTNVEWISHTIKLFSFVMPGELRVFQPKDAGQARAWITD